MRGLEANKESRSAVKMESDTGAGKRRHCLKPAVDVIPFVFSVVSFAFCFLLSVQTSDIKDRVVDLESGSGARFLSPFNGLTIDQFNALVQDKVDKLLSQVSVPKLFKIRIHSINSERLTVMRYLPQICRLCPHTSYTCPISLTIAPARIWHTMFTCLFYLFISTALL